MRKVVPGLLMILAASQAQAQVSPRSQTASVPAGTRLLTQLQRPLHTQSAKPGDTLYLQTTFPVSINGTILIPAGSHIVATLDTIAPHFWRTRPKVDLAMHVTSLLFANGYVATFSDPAHAVTSEKEGLRAEPRGATAASMAIVGLTAPVAGAALGAKSGPGGAVVGGAIGFAVTLAAAAVTQRHGTDVVMAAGVPIEVVLQEVLTLDAGRAAAPAPASSYAQIPLPRDRHHGDFPHSCYDPGIPGTPDIIIPGTPGTPAIGDVPGTPGTPDIVVPGQPATPGFWYPC